MWYHIQGAGLSSDMALRHMSVHVFEAFKIGSWAYDELLIAHRSDMVLGHVSVQFWGHHAEPGCHGQLKNKNLSHLKTRFTVFFLFEILKKRSKSRMRIAAEESLSMHT
jgi:hypothetical protein